MVGFGTSSPLHVRPGQQLPQHLLCVDLAGGGWQSGGRAICLRAKLALLEPIRGYIAGVLA